MTENEKKAAVVLAGTTFHNQSLGPSTDSARKFAAELSAAGLLRTELDDRAREACKLVAKYYKDCRDGSSIAEVQPAVLVGRAILAAEKPVERWTLEPDASNITVSVFENGTWRARFWCDADAKDYIAHKKAEGK